MPFLYPFKCLVYKNECSYKFNDTTNPKKSPSLNLKTSEKIDHFNFFNSKCFLFLITKFKNIETLPVCFLDCIKSLTSLDQFA